MSVSRSRRVTIKDVAALAGVSVTTVSRVLNGHDTNHMRPETKARVLKAIETLEYTPLRPARSLRRQRTGMIGVVVPDNSNPFFALLARGAETQAFRFGYSIIICDSNHSIEKEQLYLDKLVSEGVEGIIFVSVGSINIKKLSALQKQDIKIVAADRRVPGLPTVEADNKVGMKELTLWVLALGYKRIAYVGGPETLSTARDRFEGFLEALHQAGVKPAKIIRGNFTYESGYEAAKELLHSRPNVDIIMCGNDMMAIGAIRAACEAGLRVPDDIGVTGFDGIPWFQFLYPALSTVEVPVMQIGGEAVSQLMCEEPSQNTVLPVRLIQGESVREKKG